MPDNAIRRPVYAAFVICGCYDSHTHVSMLTPTSLTFTASSSSALGSGAGMDPAGKGHHRLASRVAQSKEKAHSSIR
jgi:hypothetical protein